MLQNKIDILCTKAIDEALIKDAASKNIFIDASSFIRTEPIRSKEIKQEIEQAFMLTATVVFTSANAVEAVAAELGEQKPDWKIFCIGHATCQLAKKYFEKNLIAGSADNARELAGLIIHKADSEVIFFCGDQRRNELPDLLRKNNIRVKEMVIYQTIATPYKIEKKYDGILFFSPTGVQSFFQKNKLDNQTILFAIGNTTADEIRKYLLADNEGSRNKIIISDQPKKETLLQKAINYFQIHSILY